MPPRFPAGLEGELGQPGATTVAGWVQNWEETPELQWPASTYVYNRMRKTDAQTQAVLRALTLPQRRATWRLAGDDVNPVVLNACQVEMGLTPEGRGRRRRRRQGISFDEAHRHALLRLPFGHLPLEQVYEVGPPGPDQDGCPPLMAHVAKLAPRMPQTIARFEVARDGGLDAIHQWIQLDDGRFDTVRIPIDRLAFFVHEREGADWTGTSLLRSSYKHWMLKEILERIGPMAVERNGMGFPVVTFDPAIGTESRALELARSVRGGEDAGMALPTGYSLDLKGVTGSIRDELPLLKWHEQAIGKNALLMVLDLGHDAGARSLGDTFTDLFAMAAEGIADDTSEVFTEHVLRDFVRLNWGEDEPYPELVADADAFDPSGALTAEALKSLVEAEVILPDDDLEDEIRRRHGLPERSTPRQPEAPPVPPAFGIPTGDLPPAIADDPLEVAARARALAGRLEHRAAAGLA